jgi:glycyl-tRNA synthetase
MSASLEDIVSLSKRRGFVYQGSEIYGGLAGTWDYGPLGTLLRRNIVNEWLKYFVDGWSDMYQIDSAILMNPKVWQASGHVDTFTDPLEDGSKFNTMFQTTAGVGEDNTTIYLRPETAQGMFTNYRNILDTFSPDLPFGIAQVGKAFRNEISPRDFIFRVQEFEIMEFEYFIPENIWEAKFEKWRKDMHAWFKHIGLSEDKIKEIEVPEDDRAHYSKRTIDFEYDFPSLGFSEVGGLAYRTDFDLKNHQEATGKDMSYRPKDGSAPFIPHVIEPTFGVDRNLLAVLSNAYSEDEQGGEKRTYLKLPAHLAPVKAAVFPLLKNKPELVAKAKEVHKLLRKANSEGMLGQRSLGEVVFDDNGNIGKRYRRQDEIGTPYTITIDFQTLEDDTVTIRHRDNTEQTRQKISELKLDEKI